MPELPDLQVIADNLDEIYNNCRLLNIYLADKAKTNAEHKKFFELLVDKRVKQISRLGKVI